MQDVDLCLAADFKLKSHLSVLSKNALEIASTRDMDSHDRIVINVCPFLVSSFFRLLCRSLKW